MTPLENQALRFAHFSDIHVTARRLGWRLRDLLTKRATGWVNVRLLGRGARFRDAVRVAGALARDIREQRVDLQVFSGDATTMGFRPEFEEAARLLGIGQPGAPPGIAVPGNHDQYTRSVLKEAAFESAFADWQKGERIDGHAYPFALRRGGFWFVGLNSSRPNFLAWDARGGVGSEQRARFEELLRRLPPGPRVVVTHYPLYLANGLPEGRWRRLRDWRDTLDIARHGGVCLWLHGHRHAHYTMPIAEALPFPTVCAGSATQRGRWSYNVCEMTASLLVLRRRTFDDGAGTFVESGRSELTLRRSSFSAEFSG